MNGDWVISWGSMPQLTEPDNLPPAPFTGNGVVLAGATLRQTIRVSLGGQRIRLRFSNAFGDAVLPITAAYVALPADGRAGSSAIEPGTSRAVTFDGQASVRVPVGAQVVSDPLDFPVAPGADLAVTLYLAAGQASTNITSHPGSRTTSHLVGGDHAEETKLAGATPVEHWYFLSALEVCAGPGSAAAVMLGDSLTDGRGSTTDGNDRWPDRLMEKLYTLPDLAGVAIVNQAAGGNRVLNDGLGPSAVSRFERDVLAHSGVAWLVVFEGINDIGTTEVTRQAQEQVAADLIAAYGQFVRQAHTHGIRVYGATIAPFGGNDNYDDPAGLREATRQVVNDWIRTSGRYDAVLDFDRAVRDPARPRYVLPAYDLGDGLHLNPAGYQALADAVPAGLFRREEQAATHL